MSLKMSGKSTEEILKIMCPKYARRGREARGLLLNGFCQLCGFERKYAIKLLGDKRRGKGAMRVRAIVERQFHPEK